MQYSEVFIQENGSSVSFLNITADIEMRTYPANGNKMPLLELGRGNNGNYERIGDVSFLGVRDLGRRKYQLTGIDVVTFGVEHEVEMVSADPVEYRIRIKLNKT